MPNYIPLLILFTLAIYAQANGCTYDFNQDSKCDTYTVVPLESAEGLSIVTISLGSDGDVSGVFNTGSGGIAPGYFPGEIIIPLHFDSSRTVQQSTYTFRWKDSLKNWVLVKESNWSEPYRDEAYSLGGEHMPKEARFPTDFETKRIKCCILLSDFTGQAIPPYSTLDENQSTAAVTEDIYYLEKLLTTGKKSSLFYKRTPESEHNRKPIPADLIYELSTALTTKNVETLNNYAFYMQQTDNNILAIMLLRSIHEKFPQRVVATLNLADSYWQVNMKEDACPLYKEYRSSMVSLGKQALIPNRVDTRLTCYSFPEKADGDHNK